MSQRYTELFNGPKNLYLKGSPIIISAHVLLKDNEKNKVLAQIKFQNISDKKIIAIKILIKCQDVKGNDIEDDIEYTYLDLGFSRGEYSGDRIPVYLKNESSRFYTITIKEVVFEDKTSWISNKSPDKWIEIPPNQSINNILTNNKLLNLYSSKLKIKPLIRPSEFEDLWFCTCGCINHDSEETCYQCKNKKDDIFTYANEAKLEPEYVKIHEANKSKTKKVFIPLVLSLIILVGIYFIYSWLTRPLPINYTFDDIKSYIESQSEIELVDYSSKEARKFDDFSYIEDYKEFYFLEKNEICIGTLRRTNQDVIISIDLDWNKDSDEVSFDTNINNFDVYIYENLSDNSTIFIDANFKEELENYSQSQFKNDLNKYDECFYELFTAMDQDIFNSLDEAIKLEEDSEIYNNELKSEGFDDYEVDAIRLELYSDEDGYWYEKHIETPSLLSTSYSIDNSQEYTEIQEKIEEEEEKEREMNSINDSQEDSDFETSGSSTNGTWAPSDSDGHWNIYTGGWSEDQ